MSKKILMVLIALLGVTQVVAQEHEYIPFVREGVKWVYTNDYSLPNQQKLFTLELKGDATINGKTYKVMHKYSGESINWDDDTIPVYLREENKIVYGIVPDGKIYDECPVGIARNTEMLEKLSAGEEFILYDFSDPVKFIESWCTMPDDLFCKVISDTVTIAGRKSKRYMSKCTIGDFCMIEGIGYDGLFAGYPLALQHRDGTRDVSLDYVVENGEVIYRSERYNLPEGFHLSNILPLAREGVQWVNERVVIDHGEIKKSYYTYEFKGTNMLDHPVCYTYTDDILDTSTAMKAAVFKVPDGYDGPAINYLRPYYIYDNPAYDTVLEEGRNLMSFISSYGWKLLYQFSQSYSKIDMSNLENFYILYQKEPILSHSNFFEVDPLVIEGMECRRYAYVGEDGEPLAYITEGIGFDSRDMGDLLTPFTRKPDPDAEYQEYWGLSHVIKDGEIIYKGMRYDPSLFEGSKGDVNGDGKLSIADVTALIDLLLRDDVMFRSPCDLDDNGSLSIADVTALIDLLLSDAE